MEKVNEVYLIRRVKEKQENYKKFTNLIIDNINSKENIKKLITTIILIIYLNREREE